MALISRLSHEESPDTIVRVCQDLARLLLDNPGYRRHIIPNHGVLPFVDILEVPNVPSRVLASVLRVVNLITRDDRRLQEAVSLVGALPAILNLARPASASVVRMHVADFVRQLCTTSTVTLQMLVACGGIQVRLAAHGWPSLACRLCTNVPPGATYRGGRSPSSSTVPPPPSPLAPSVARCWWTS